jgi:creatinine amidohydrolase
LEELTPSAARARIADNPMLLIPIGGTAAQEPHLPLGVDSLIVNRLTDDVSARRGILRAPVLNYGVHPNSAAQDGGAALRRKTLHRTINELIDCWEDGAGIKRFILLTALANDSHLEALTTVRTERAAVLALDVLGFEFGDRLSAADTTERGRELAMMLVCFLAPHLVGVGTPGRHDAAGAERGRDLYHFILERILHLIDAGPQEVK